MLPQTPGELAIFPTATERDVSEELVQITHVLDLFAEDSWRISNDVGNVYAAPRNLAPLEERQEN